MAGSRLDKIGNIFSRMTGLLRTGAIKYEERPIWYDVYRIFPPKYEPRYARELEEVPEIHPILYQEDIIRAKVFKKYGLNPGGMVRDLAKNEEDTVQKFVNAFNAAKVANPDQTDDEVFETVASTFVFPTSPYRRMGARQRLRDSSTEGESSRRRARLPPQTEDEDVFLESESDTLNPQYRRKVKIITQESLLSLFKEAQSDSSPSSKSSETLKSTDKTDKKEDS